MSFYFSIYYFMIGNYKTHHPIGNYINNNISGNNFDNIKFTCDDIFHNSSSDLSINKKNKIVLDYYIIFYTLKPSGIFYLSVTPKDSLYDKDEDLIFLLFEDIENQGIKKLVNAKGVLSRIGKQNLRFSIELFQENNRKNNENKKGTENNKDNSKIALLNNEINDIHANMKKSVKNMIVNVNDMQELDDKSNKIKDSSFQFQKDASNLEKQLKYKKLIRKVIIYSSISIIVLFLLYLILK